MGKKIVFLTLAAALVIPFANVSAETQDVTANETLSKNADSTRQQMMQNREQFKAERQQQKEDNQQQRQTFKEEKCKNIETRIDTRIKRYENNQAMFQKVFGNMKARLDRLTARLDSAGADTAKLKTDTQTLNGKIDKLNTDYAAFIDSLKKTQSLACGQSQGEFAGKLGEARKLLPQIVQDRKDIRSFFQGTIKPDLMNIRQTIKDDKEQTKNDNQPSANKNITK